MNDPKTPTPAEEHDVVQTGETKPDPDAPADVAHDKHQAEVSQQAAKGEQVAAKAESEADKAAELRALSNRELVAIAERAYEAEKWLDVARRSQAEFENFQKRISRERAEDARFALTSFAREVLPVLDNLDRAIEAAEKAGSAEALLQGVRMTRDMMCGALSRFGIKPIDAEGKPFDPAFHEALMVQNVADKDNNVVLTVFERGWLYHERVLRAAKVVVNKK